MRTGGLMELTLHDSSQPQAYLARPDDAPHPGVLLFMDAIGLRRRIFEMADRIASWGYIVLAPNVFHRSGSVEELAPSVDLREPGARESFMRTAMTRVARLKTPQALADIDDYLAALVALPGVQAPVGVVGYCMGARLAVRAACAHPQVVAACAGFHGGRLATDADDSPHLGLPSATARFLFGHADRDSSMPISAVDRLGQALAGAGLESLNTVVPDAPHGYTMSDTPAFQQEGSEWHFEQLRILLEQTLTQDATPIDADS